MTVVINGTTGVSGVAGSASTPALIGSDADSGYYINSANEPNASVNGTATWSAASTFGFKNRLINGGMVIDQRNAGASVTPANDAFTLDRWKTVALQASKFTIQQNAGAVTPPAGFSNYLGVTSSSAYSVLTGDTFAVMQPIEGFNCADLAWGTASASSVTLSFWVRSSLTGVFGGSLWSGSRGYVFTYSIASSNTWEYKTVTIAGDTSGTYSSTNSLFTQVRFGLGSGSTFSGSAGSWGTSNLVQPTGATSVVGTNGATFYITGVQLEKGSTATSFDYRPYGTELALCQRYYWRLSATGGGPLLNFGAASSATQSTAVGNYQVEMRSAPTFDYSSIQISTASGGTAPVTSNDGITSTVSSYRIFLGISSGGLTTNTFPYFVRANGTGWIAFSAEL